MAETSGHWDGAGLERKIRAAGRPWAVGDIAMVAEGQWAVRTKRRTEEREGYTAVERRVEDGGRVELTLEELASAVGAWLGEPHREEG